MLVSSKSTAMRPIRALHMPTRGIMIPRQATITDGAEIEAVKCSPNFSLHWTGSSQSVSYQQQRYWRLLPASELCVTHSPLSFLCVTLRFLVATKYRKQSARFFNSLMAGTTKKFACLAACHPNVTMATHVNMALSTWCQPPADWVWQHGPVRAAERELSGDGRARFAAQVECFLTDLYDPINI